MNAITTRLAAVLVWCPLAIGCADAATGPAPLAAASPTTKIEEKSAPPLTLDPMPVGTGDKEKPKKEEQPKEEEKETVLATAKHPKGLVVDLLEVKADENEFLVIRWRYTNPTKRKIRLVEGNGPFKTVNPPTS